MSANEMKTKYVKISTLCKSFELCEDYFERRRLNNTYKLNKHYIIAPDTRFSKTKKTILWVYSEIEAWFTEDVQELDKDEDIDEEVMLLLARKKK